MSTNLARVLLGSRKQSIFAVAAEFFHNPFGDEFDRVRQFGSFLQVFKVFKRLLFTLIYDLPHVFLADAWNEFQRVHSWSNCTCSVEELNEPFFTVQHYSVDDR
jgi:hypothetical protein